MKTKLYIKRSCLVLLLIATLAGCKKFIQVPAPATQAEESRIFQDDQTATSATVGLYYQLTATNSSFWSGATTVDAGLSADEIANATVGSSDENFRYNMLLASNTNVKNYFWTAPYRFIYQANAVLEGLQNSTGLTKAVKEQLQGEMLYIRAYHYFYLANTFGDVPLQTGTDYSVNAVMPRTASLIVYKQIEDDLLQSRQLLDPSFATSVNTRPNKGAAAGLLARVYLYEKKWQESETMATEVISSGKYAMEPLANAFLNTSKESVFSLTRVNGNAEGSIFVPPSATAKPLYVVTPELIAAFESGDNRKTNWLKTNSVSGINYTYPYKYKTRATTPVTESYIIQRLAEIYLIRAEARANQGRLSDAIDDIDVVRARAGLVKIKTSNPGIGKDALLISIAHERQVELFAEWGHRWYDLKRTGTADQVLGPLKGANWQSTDVLYPIPLAEIQLNPFLTQNPGYTTN